MTRDEQSKYRLVLYSLIVEAEVRGKADEADILAEIDAIIASLPTSDYGHVPPWPENVGEIGRQEMM